MDRGWYRLGEGEIILFVWAQPGAKKNEFVGILDNALKIKVKAPPVEGAANKEIVAFLAATLGLAKSSIDVASGETSRRKKIIVPRTTATEEFITRYEP